MIKSEKKTIEMLQRELQKLKQQDKFVQSEVRPKMMEMKIQLNKRDQQIAVLKNKAIEAQD